MVTARQKLEEKAAGQNQFRSLSLPLVLLLRAALWPLAYITTGPLLSILSTGS